MSKNHLAFRRHVMCKSILGSTLVVAMFWSVASPAQSAHKTSSSTEVTPRESSSSLLARSQMQAPKPIPVIRPLRFQEIPASSGVTSGGEHQSVGTDNSPANAENRRESEPALLSVPQTDRAH
jgi:hypothetical protein